MTGWVRLHRSLSEWRWYQNPNTMRVFVHCLLSANWKDADWQDITIRRGSFLTSYQKIANDLLLTRQQVRTAFSNMQKTREVTLESTGGGLLVTLCNFDVYNSEEMKQQHANQHAINTRANTLVTPEQHSDNTQITPIEEGKKNKKVKKEEDGRSLLIPETLPETLKAALADWKRHRTEIKKPITPTQWVKLVEDGQADPARMAATIRNSILSGYQGLFPEKVQPADMAAAQTTKKLQLPANWREIAATIYDNPPTCSEDELTEDQRAEIYRNSR